jgi:hypothetical protein
MMLSLLVVVVFSGVLMYPWYSGWNHWAAFAWSATWVIVVLAVSALLRAKGWKRR